MKSVRHSVLHANIALSVCRHENGVSQAQMLNYVVCKYTLVTLWMWVAISGLGHDFALIHPNTSSVTDATVCMLSGKRGVGDSIHIPKIRYFTKLYM